MARVVLTLAFILTFAAGLIVGVGYHRNQARPAATRPSGMGGMLTAELNLDSRQQEQLDKIWSQTARRGWREHEDHRRQLRKERDEAIAALLGPGDREKFDQIQRSYQEKMQQLEKEARAMFQASVERTKQILNPEQRAKYEALLKRLEAERAQREQERRAETRAASRPATNPTTQGAAPR